MIITLFSNQLAQPGSPLQSGTEKLWFRYWDWLFNTCWEGGRIWRVVVASRSQTLLYFVYLVCQPSALSPGCEAGRGRWERPGGAGGGPGCVQSQWRHQPGQSTALQSQSHHQSAVSLSLTPLAGTDIFWQHPSCHHQGQGNSHRRGSMLCLSSEWNRGLTLLQTHQRGIKRLLSRLLLTNWMLSIRYSNGCRLTVTVY